MRLFEVDPDAEQALDSLSLRVQRLVEAAMNYHSLVQPSRTLTYKFYMGEKWQLPCLTDTSTLNGSATTARNLKPIFSWKATSTVKPKTLFSPHVFTSNGQIADRNIRHILLTPDDATESDVENHRPESVAQRTYNFLERKFPALFDAIREPQRAAREKKWNEPIEPYVPLQPDELFERGLVHHPVQETKPALEPKHNAPKAVLIGMHWLQAGGAERWAIETITLTKRAGMTPIVLTDIPSHQPLIASQELDNALILCLTPPIPKYQYNEPLLRSLFEQFDIRGVLVHHCQWLYDRLYWIKRYFPAVPVVDSLHIVEYRDHGGYPNQAVSRDAYIDIHHVISPQLVSWLSDIHGVSISKIVDAPLVGLTSSAESPTFKKRVEEGKLSISFVGRITRQKRPEAFVLLASRLKRLAASSFRVIMHGSGEFDEVIDDIMKKRGLSSFIERRSSAVPVSDTYKDSDVLVITAVNEGITLTTIEALSAGIPVISADIGSQRTLIPEAGLVPRETSKLVRTTAELLEKLLNDETARKELWMSEMTLLRDFSKLESANAYFTRLLSEWSSHEQR